jgi:predicted acylesterase/phospholipase RssA
VAGTSTGGVVALGVVFPGTDETPPYSARQLVNFYLEEGPKIFFSRFGVLRQVIDEKYPTAPLETTLQRYFGEITLGEASTPVIVPTYDVAAAAPHFFKSSREVDAEIPMWRIARATTAAPTFFEPYQIETREATHALIDGGMVANNPAMCALAEVTNHIENYALVDGFRKPIMIVSLGSGRLPGSYRYETIKDWTVLEWARPSIEITIMGAVEMVHYQLEQIMRNRDERLYYRFQPVIPQAIRAMDDTNAGTLAQLQEIAADLIAAQQADLDELIGKLLA